MTIPIGNRCLHSSSRFGAKTLLIAACILFTQTCIAQSDVSITSLKFIDDYVIPFGFSFKGTIVGGLSGIDYDKERNVYYLLCDDRSDINPVRFYTAKINLAKDKIDTVLFSDLRYLLQQNGKPYRSFKLYPSQSVDPEDLRINSKTGVLYWSSEGERILNGHEKVLIKPFIQLAKMDGSFLGTFPLPKILEMQSSEMGPRRNGTIEGITFDKNFNTLYAALEEPLFEDGPRADVTKTNSWVRLFQFDVATKKNAAQYAYSLEPVAYPATPSNEFKVNGISEILSLGKNQLLTVERSYSTGRLPCTIKVFLTDFGQADNIKDVKSLKETPPAHPVKKTLLLNMDDLGIYTDNVEGVTFGPKLANGHSTLIFITDDNFQSAQKTQLLLFEIIP
jgi:hypothetical protein